jgi:hypothetical protein
MIRISRSPSWKPVQNARTVHKTCPRCNNEVDFYLACDNSKGFGIVVEIFKYAYIYALHCPICIHTEEVSETVATALRK